MNYRHSFHAGNFADIVKHLAFILVLEKLKEKDKPFCIIDTHAGQGIYDLYSQESIRTQEADMGIMKIWPHLLSDPLFHTYCRIIKAVNNDEDQLQFYPGSPYIARYMMRMCDRLFASELHPDCIDTLTHVLQRSTQVHILQQDAYQSIKSLLPPLEKRGVVIIDPAFEKTDEVTLLIHGMRQALKRFSRGIYLIWYPIKDTVMCRQLVADIFDLHSGPVMNIHFQMDQRVDTQKLSGCGLLVLNAPWQFKERFGVMLQNLLMMWQIQDKGCFSIIEKA